MATTVHKQATIAMFITQMIRCLLELTVAILIRSKPDVMYCITEHYSEHLFDTQKDFRCSLEHEVNT